MTAAITAMTARTARTEAAMRRAARTAFLAGLAAALPGAGTAAAEEPAARPRIAVLVEPESQDATDAAAGLVAALRSAPPGRGADVVERLAGTAESDRRAALVEMALEGAAVIVAIGERVARLAPEAVRDRPVVVVSMQAPGGFGDRVYCVETAPEAERVAAEVRRAVPAARRVALAGGDDGTAGVLSRALRRPRPGAAGEAAEVVRLVWSDAGATWNASGAKADAVVTAPETAARDVGAIARSLAGTGTALVGTRAEHFDAGAALVLRPSARDAGEQAAAACAEALTGKASSRVLRPARLLREVHLANARRLGFAVPLGLLAASDRIVPAPRERK